MGAALNIVFAIIILAGIGMAVYNFCKNIMIKRKSYRYLDYPTAVNIHKKTLDK
jgi:hypothetical protein